MIVNTGKLPRAALREIEDRILNPLNVIQLSIANIDPIIHKADVERIERAVKAISEYVRSLEGREQFDGGAE